MKRNFLKVSTFVFLSMIAGSAISQEMPQFNSDEEKEAWIQANPAAYERMMNSSGYVHPNTIQPVNNTGNRIDAPGYPQYVNTGNPEADAKAFSEAKAKWIAENQEAYNQMAGIENPVAPSKSISDFPGFPSFVDTGNPEADYLKYKAAKEAWYAENQELVNEFYRQNAENSKKINKN